MLFPTLVGAVSAIMAWENRGHRTCVLDGEQMEYKCVINEHSVETGKFQNVYIRLKAQKHGKLSLSYRPARPAVSQCAPNFKDFRCNKVIISFINHVNKRKQDAIGHFSAHYVPGFDVRSRSLRGLAKPHFPLKTLQ